MNSRKACYKQSVSIGAGLEDPDVELIGYDGWLLFGKKPDGTLVQAVVECDPQWLDIPESYRTEERSFGDDGDEYVYDADRMDVFAYLVDQGILDIHVWEPIESGNLDRNHLEDPEDPDLSKKQRHKLILECKNRRHG